MAVRVETESQVGTSHDSAKVRIYKDDTLVTEIIAYIDYQQGADGGYYPCVILKQENVQKE